MHSLLIVLFSISVYGCNQPAPCSSGLVAIPPTDPQYCLMAFEAVVREGKAYSEKGTLPSTLFSHREAVSLCKSTPVLSTNGSVLGHMRLATLAEWQDAGDGVLGDGGNRFPWGSEADFERCVLQGRNDYKEPQPSGSLPDCRSQFGVYDQLGNLWEWVDGKHNIDINLWLDARKNEGYKIELVDGTIRYGESHWWNFYVHSTDFRGGKLIPNANGLLSVQADKTVNRPATGYLISKKRERLDATGIIPIDLDFSEDSKVGVIHINYLRDQEAIAIKIGGAYYSGADADLNAMFYGHGPDFNGSVGFRCSSDVIKNNW